MKGGKYRKLSRKLDQQNHLNCKFNLYLSTAKIFN